MTGLIYPYVVAWTWGGGWLSNIGFDDYSGAGIVHFCGGSSAVAACIILGPRLGKFTDIVNKKNIDVIKESEK
jgi:Amt family ammonium transporter